MSKVANSIRRGLEEAVAFARGEANLDAYRVHGSTRAYLMVIDRAPKAVQKALDAA